MPRTHSTYPADFRSEAVRLVWSGTPVSTVAKDLDVNQQTLRNWLRQHDIDRGRRSDGLTTEEREELFRLRRRVKVLEEEKQILLKASAFFAKETDRNR
jgi:transposase